MNPFIHSLEHQETALQGQKGSMGIELPNCCRIGFESIVQWVRKQIFSLLSLLGVCKTFNVVNFWRIDRHICLRTSAYLFAYGRFFKNKSGLSIQYVVDFLSFYAILYNILCFGIFVCLLRHICLCNII